MKTRALPAARLAVLLAAAAVSCHRSENLGNHPPGGGGRDGGPADGGGAGAAGRGGGLGGNPGSGGAAAAGGGAGTDDGGRPDAGGPGGGGGAPAASGGAGGAIGGAGGSGGRAGAGGGGGGSGGTASAGTGGAPGAGGGAGSGAGGGGAGRGGIGGLPGSGGAIGSGSGGTVGSGGAQGTGGGGAGTGGAPGTGGGAVGSGGAVGTGGAQGTGGGAVGSGGEPGSGGAVGSGGDPGSGGTIGSGGDPGSGGVVGTGGVEGTGGDAVGSGGSGSGGAGSGGSGGAGGAPPSCGERQYPCASGCCMFAGGVQQLGGIRPTRSVSLDFRGAQPWFLWGVEDFDIGTATPGGTFGWTGAPVDDGGDLGRWVTLRFDSAGTGHAIYWRGGFNEILYGRMRTGETQFTPSVVITGTINNGGVAMDLNPAERPEIVFYDNPRGVRYAVHDGTAWSFEDIEAGLMSGSPAVIVAPDGRPHIAYSRSAGGVRYGTRSPTPGTPWSTPDLDAHPWASGRIDLALGPDGTLHATYSIVGPFPNSEIRHAWLPPGGGGWQNETVWSSSTAGLLNLSALAVGSDGAVHLVFFSQGELTVFYQYRSPAGVWAAPSRLDTGQIGSTATDMAFDPNGKLNIVFVARAMYWYQQP